MAAGVWSGAAAEPWTLERALEYARVNNPDVRLAQHRLSAARAGLSQANAAFLPRLQFQSSYMRTDNPMQVFGSILNQRAFSASLDFNDVPDVDNLNAKGVATVPLYAGGRNAAGRAAAKARQTAAGHATDAVRQEVAFEVTRAFHTVLKTRQFIQATEAGVRAFEGNLAIARKRFDAGTLLKADVLDVEVRLGQAREDLVRARNASALAERALRNLLGIEAGEFIVADTAPAPAAPQSVDYAGRPELAAAEQQRRAAEAEARRARGGYLPNVHVFGSLDYDYGWKYDDGGRSYTAGAMLQWDLWDGSLTRARVREAQANLDAACEAQRRLRLAIDLEAEHARISLREAQERLAVTESVVAHASESVELTRSRFEQGLALSTQLIDAETALVAARVRRAEAESNQGIAVAALRKALGLPQLDPAPPR
ncbi:MAG: TolC family protein [Verrucomicrobia bacterium]|nr:TolC family protein [Verrucomicrobiota bacterium]